MKVHPICQSWSSSSGCSWPAWTRGVQLLLQSKHHPHVELGMQSPCPGCWSLWGHSSTCPGGDATIHWPATFCQLLDTKVTVHLTNRRHSWAFSCSMVLQLLRGQHSHSAAWPRAPGWSSCHSRRPHEHLHIALSIQAIQPGLAGTSLTVCSLWGPLSEEKGHLDPQIHAKQVVLCPSIWLCHLCLLSFSM